MTVGKGRINDCWNTIGVRGDRSCPELATHVHCHNCPVFMQAAIELLDRPVPEEYLRERTATAAIRETVVECGGETALVFRIENEWLALPANVCREVSKNLRVHTIPFRRDGFVLGLVNVRGELVISVSLGHVLGIPLANHGVPEDSLRLIIIQKDASRFAFPAQEVSGLQHYQPSGIRPVPATLASADAHYVKGIFGDTEKNIGILDEELLFYSLGKGLT